MLIALDGSAMKSRRIVGTIGFAFIAATCTSLRGLPPVDLETVRPLSPRSDAVSIIGPDGTVPHATRKRVTSRLAAIGQDNLLGRHLAAMQEVSPSPLIAGNRVELLVDGPATYAAIFDAIRSAKDSINIETYIFDEAQSRGEGLSELLIDKAEQGVVVNVLYDAVGSMSTPEVVFTRLLAAGIRTCAFNPLNPADNRTATFVQRTHRKIVVVDGRIAFSGGLNFSGTYSRSSRAVASSGVPTIEDGWRDTHVQVEGPAVQQIQQLFLESWQKQQCDPIADARYMPDPIDAGETLLRLDASSLDDQTFDTYISALAAVTYATRSIDVTMAYFVPNDRLEDELIDAARRGVRVRLLLAGFSDFSATVYAGRAHYTPLLKAGVQIYEGHKAFIHAKTLVVDGILSTVGSANWDSRSFSANDELNVTIIDAGFADQMEALFARDLADATPITLDEWRQRPFHHKVLEQFWLLWEPWL
jgi:cardiolipin synthase